MTEPTRKVLTALLDDPTRERYGLDLSKQAAVAPGTMYGILDRLEGWTWVESRIEYPADLAAPPRRYYRFTPDGASRASDGPGEAMASIPEPKLPLVVGMISYDRESSHVGAAARGAPAWCRR